CCLFYFPLYLCSALFVSFYFHSPPLHLASLPTRRSSDLGRMMPAPIAWITLDNIRMPKFGDQPPMIVPISRHVSENMTSVLAEKVRDKYPDIGMNMMVVRMKALVSHWTWVALTLNSSMI